MFEEIIYPEPPKPKKSGTCPSCGGDLHFTSIPCPEGRPGCLVAHYGHRCGSCYKIFAEVLDV